MIQLLCAAAGNVSIFKALLDRLVCHVRAVVLLPTRDLALQVFRVFESLCKALPSKSLRLHCAVGTKAVAQEKQLLKDTPPDILICTPGRLAEHFLGRDACLDLRHLRWFVVDEADRLLTQIPSSVMDRACRDAAVSVRPQKLLFSATMTWDPRKLAQLKLLRPLYFFSSRTGQHATPAQLQQHYEHVLRSAGEDHEHVKVIVFCQSVNTAHRLARLLQICCALRKVGEEAEEEAKTEDELLQDVDVAATTPLDLSPECIAEFSSTLTQKERGKLLKRFSTGKVKCLVCSDVVARGIDIPEVTAVVNYSAPSHIQTYIHRVGRTARAGKVGHTFTFVTRGDMDRFEKMLRESADCWERISKFPIPKEARSRKKIWWTPALEALQRCLDSESKGHLSVVKPIDEETLMGNQGRPKGAVEDESQIAEDYVLHVDAYSVAAVAPSKRSFQPDGQRVEKCEESRLSLTKCCWLVHPLPSAENTRRMEEQGRTLHGFGAWLRLPFAAEWLADSNVHVEPKRTQQMASLNQMVQAQQRMQSLLNGLVNPDDETIANEERRKREQEEQKAEAEVSQKFIWRLCVYSGEDLPRDTMYVYLKIVDQVHGDKIFKSHVSSESSKPVWEFVVEETIMVDSIHGPPRLEIQLYGQRVLLDVLDRYLGQAVLKLPGAPTMGPMKSSLPVALNSFSAMNDKIAAQFGVSRKARLNVVWQVCDEKHPGPAPDLIRIAEMDEDASDRRSYQFHLKVINVKLRRATEGPRRLAVCLRLIQPDGEVSKASPVQHSPQAWSCPESRVIENLEDPSKEMPPADPDEEWGPLLNLECNTAVWCEDRRLGWTMPTWMLRESHLQLLSYTIEAQLLMYSSGIVSLGLPAKEQAASRKKFNFFRNSNLGGAQEDKPTKLGVWRESLGDLLDSIEQSDEGLVCEAPFTSREGTEVATVRMEIDVSSAQAHHMPHNLVSKDISSWPVEKAPLRRGAPPKGPWSPLAGHFSICASGYASWMAHGPNWTAEHVAN
eukprot:s568_g20.t1